MKCSPVCSQRCAKDNTTVSGAGGVLLAVIEGGRHDNMAIQKLMLENDEEEARKVANFN